MASPYVDMDSRMELSLGLKTRKQDASKGTAGEYYLAYRGFSIVFELVCTRDDSCLQEDLGEAAPILELMEISKPRLI